MSKNNPKTVAGKVLQGYYDGQWADICEYYANDSEEMKQLEDDYKAYRENEDTAHRIIDRRLPNPKYKEEKETEKE